MMRDPTAANVSEPPRAAAPGARSARGGVLLAVAAYGAWGVFPVYFKVVREVPPLEILAHRIVWSFALLVVILLALRRPVPLRALLTTPRTLRSLVGSTLLIAANWLVFIWAVTHNHVMEASLGYYVNPLVNVLLGAVFLRERLRPVQLACVGLAALAVGALTVASGHFPVIALVLALTFGFYGLLRKTVAADALVGLTVETGLLLPVALGFLATQMVSGRAVFGPAAPGLSVWLLCAGPVTALPLLWFAAAARRLRLATMGFIQYLAPTGHFLLAVLVYGEPFERVHGLAFALIWTALAIYSAEAALRGRRAAGAARMTPGDVGGPPSGAAGA
jgi:chloramphenicol-sensitive protein RarD